MTQEQIVDKVKKLLELSNSSNVNEASVAAGQAQKLMEKHNITQAMLKQEGDEEIDEDIEYDVLHGNTYNKLATWKANLAATMCDLNGCSCLYLGGQIRIVGRPTDANGVRYLFSYVTREIDRLAKAEGKLRGRPGRTWYNSFRMGATQAVRDRLIEAHRQARAEMKQEAYNGDTDGTGTALMRVNTAIQKLDSKKQEVKSYVKRVIKPGGPRRFQSTYFDGGGYRTGVRAGENIDLSNGKGKLGSGPRKQLTE